MANGEVSEPIRAGEGWHIVRLMNTQAAGPQPLAEVRSMIVASLRQQKAQAEQQKYIVRLLQKSPITIREAQLRAAVK
jgi:peptidylprolyl isomerase